MIYLTAFAGPLEPLPQQLFAVTVERCRVPMRTAELVSSVKKLQALLIRGGSAVESFDVKSVCYPISMQTRSWYTYCSNP